MQRAAEHGDATLADLRSYFCDASWCPAIIDGSLVYTDDHHLTDEFSARLATPMLQALQPALDRARDG